MPPSRRDSRRGICWQVTPTSTCRAAPGRWSTLFVPVQEDRSMLNKGSVLSATTACSILLFGVSPAFGTHPLFTDDTLTQGKGKSQVEMSFQYEHDDDSGIKTELSKPKL